MKNIISAPIASKAIAENKQRAQATIKKVLNVNCGSQNAEHIGAAFMGFKNAQTVKAMAENSYTATAKLGEDTTLSLDLGVFESHCEAVKVFKDTVLNCEYRNIEWELCGNDQTYITTTKKAECYYRQPTYVLSQDSQTDSYIISDNDDNEYKITENEMDAAEFFITQTDSHIDTLATLMPPFPSGSEEYRRTVSIAKAITTIDDLDDEYILVSMCNDTVIVSESDNFEEFNSICEKLIKESIENGNAIDDEDD
ncbi:hypothetical protein [Photobacterium damselae]|uniref:hypothetical protein n=1 Tax=Photobacterium damselae TaxID=38293 RepID=UPI004067803C